MNPHAALTADEQQLLVYVVWLLEPLAESDRETVLTRLQTRLSRAGSDHLALMHELEDTIIAVEAAEPARFRNRESGHVDSARYG